jgi:hypothetical protein
MKKAVVVLGIALVLAGTLISIDLPVALILGWIGFLASVLPRITVHWPSLIVGLIALVLFTLGMQWAGRTWRRSVRMDAPSHKLWKLRWSFAVVASVVVFFASGIALVGITHQLVWLFSSDRPMVVVGTPLGLEALRQSAAKTQAINNMKQVALAFHLVHDTYRKFPSGVFDSEGKMLHSWETAVLSGIPYATVGIDRGRPWDDAVNQKYLKCIIPEFINPRSANFEVVNADGYGLNHYAGNIHVLGPDRPVKTFADFTDGASNTLLFGEIGSHFRPWAQPGNWRDPALGLNRFPGGFGGPGGDGAYFAFADGSVRYVSDRVGLETLRALSTPSGGEKIDDWE